MSDRDTFLRAIRANPDDDTLRLVFADWLDEHDDPLGQLIWVQIELDPIRGQIDRPRVRELLDREADLLGRHGRRWVGRMTDLDAARPGFGPVFRRGLPELVCMSLDNFLTRGGELFEDCPTVREVSIYGVAGRGAELAACPNLANVETLEIADWIFLGEGEPLVRAIAGSSIHRLKFWWFDSDQGYCITTLAREPAWRGFIEIVEVAREIGDYAGSEADSINGIRGRHQGATVTRLSEARFPLMGDFGRGLFAGRLKDGSQALMRTVVNTATILTFGDDGVLASAMRETCLAPAWTLDRLRDRFGFKPGLIRVREFDNHDGRALRLWPRSYVNDYLGNPFPRPAGWTNEAWRNRDGVLRRWLHEGRFVIEWDGREFWADNSGTIISA
jgi:uncharacterized protein (TIGR02996 family)